MSKLRLWFAVFFATAVLGLTVGLKAHAAEVRIPLNAAEDLILTVPNDWQPPRTTNRTESALHP